MASNNLHVKKKKNIASKTSSFGKCTEHPKIKAFLFIQCI